MESDATLVTAGKTATSPYIISFEFFTNTQNWQFCINSLFLTIMKNKLTTKSEGIWVHLEFSLTLDH